MGFFSWLTKDTNESISNSSSNRGALEVWMHTPNGKSYHEKDYQGYGVFGGKDYYEVLAESNPQLLTPDLVSKVGHSLRDLGIELQFGSSAGLRYPILTRAETYVGGFENPCESCECQGFFYDESESDCDESDVEKNAPIPTSKRRAEDISPDISSKGLIQCNGRTGDKRPCLETNLSIQDDGSLMIRVDDSNNLSFWLELHVPSDALKK